MGEIVRQFLIESIALELNIGDLYQQFSAKYEQDYDFWWKLSIEEMNHAALIESINDIFLTEDFLPADKIELQTIKLRKMNYFIHENIEKFRTDNPLRADAFKLAIEIENSIGESHFELFMTSKPNSEVVKIMQKLNGDDINHASRMTKYIFKNGIL
ncbi:MAG: hypothetical protein WCJ95_09695 [Mariniphaga sp.]